MRGNRLSSAQISLITLGIVASWTWMVPESIRTASAQPCQPRWSDQFHFGGFDGPVNSLAVFDADGSGPNPPFLYAGGPFDTGGGVLAHGLVRWDGTSWSGTPSGLSSGPETMIVFDDDGPGPNAPALFVGGSHSMAGGIIARGVAKWDGSSWSAVGGGTDSTVLALAVFDDDGAGPNLPALFAGGVFTAAGGVAASHVAKWDGSSWSPLGSGVNDMVHALTVFDDDGPGPNAPALFAAGRFTQAGGAAANYIARWDGAAWSPLGSGVNDSVRALAVFDDDGPGTGLPALYVGGLFGWAGGIMTTEIARWDGAAWSALGSGVNEIVHALAVYDDGQNPPELYVGGRFTGAGGMPASRIARWSGSSWSQVAGGVNRLVTSLLVFDPDGPGPASAVLVAGGDFTTADGQPSDSIAAWNGSQWSSLGQSVLDRGMNRKVLALTTFDSDGTGPIQGSLIAGGEFTVAGQVDANHIARWDGSAWHDLDGGVSGEVLALTQFDDDGSGPNAPGLYVGGGFNRAGGDPTSHIARWDNTGWSSLGAGLPSDVLALAVFDPDDAGPQPPRLHVGSESGAFKWDGIGFSSLTTNVHGDVKALTVFDQDGPGPMAPALIAGGRFHITGLVGGQNIALWDGDAWWALDGGTDADVEALAVFDEDGPGPDPPRLFAGGRFHDAGGVFVNGIARWDGAVWTPVGNELSDVFSLSVFDADGLGPAPASLYAGGRFAFNRNGVWTYGISQWSGTAWLPLESGTGWVYALTVLAGDGTLSGPPALIAGGQFTTAGDVPSGRIAKWGCIAFVPGDLNCDERLDTADIGPFALALTDPVAYAAAFPDCSADRADLNGDSLNNGLDIRPFVDSLLGF